MKYFHKLAYGLVVFAGMSIASIAFAHGRASSDDMRASLGAKHRSLVLHGRGYVQHDEAASQKTQPSRDSDNNAQAAEHHVTETRTDHNSGVNTRALPHSHAKSHYSTRMATHHVAASTADDEAGVNTRALPHRRSHHSSHMVASASNASVSKQPVVTHRGRR